MIERRSDDRDQVARVEAAYTSHYRLVTGEVRSRAEVGSVRLEPHVRSASATISPCR